MIDRLFVLGAPDPEMIAIERLLVEREIPYVYAVSTKDPSRRVAPSETYTATLPDGAPPAEAYYFVECEIFLSPEQWAEGQSGCSIRLDHHRPGDRGFGRPPEEYWSASSIGQVWRELEGDTAPPEDLLYVAAVDHCLSHAYSGRCPGIDPARLLEWRVCSRSSFLGKTPEQLIADIRSARAALTAAPIMVLRTDSAYSCADAGCGCGQCFDIAERRIIARDMRAAHVPELPEAGCLAGECYVAVVPPDATGRKKVVCQGGSPDQIRAFMNDWAPAEGLTGIYGDPERGFAGGYV